MYKYSTMKRIIDAVFLAFVYSVKKCSGSSFTMAVNCPGL
jgi:hypothetical protein